MAMKVERLQVLVQESMESLIDLQGILREQIPTSDIDIGRHPEGRKLLDTALKTLHEISGVAFERETKQPSVVLDGVLVLVARKELEEILNDLRIKGLEVFMTGGPLRPLDYKQLNPDLSEKALDGIGRKIEKVLSKIAEIASKASAIVLFGVKDTVVDELLALGAPMLEESIEKPVLTRLIGPGEKITPVLLKNLVE